MIEVIDIRNDPFIINNTNTLDASLVVCPPTCYLGADGTYFTYKYLGGTINPVPQYLFDCLKQLRQLKQLKNKN